MSNLTLLGTNRPPELELKNAKGLSNDNLKNLQAELNKLAAEQCGEVSIHSQTHVQSHVC